MPDPLTEAVDAMQNETLTILVSRTIAAFRRTKALDASQLEILDQGVRLTDSIRSGGLMFTTGKRQNAAGLADYGVAISALENLKRTSPDSFSAATKTRKRFMDLVDQIRKDLVQIRKGSNLTDRALQRVEDFFEALSSEYEREIRPGSWSRT